jgi:DNA primase
MGIIDEIRDRLDIVEIVSLHVPLRKTGKNFKGSCPFHSEKTPSFVVYPEDWGYHCFGCGAHGTGIDFVMAMQKLDFGEALRYLAEKAGITLPERHKDTEGDAQREKLYRINEAAAQYFHSLLLHPSAGTAAREYLVRRGLTKPIWESFQLGYSADSWDSLLHYMQNKGYAVADLIGAGLVVEREEGGGVYDRFRHRLMFPIRDRDGRLSGFGARIMGDGQPKYLNSPQTAVFDKGAILYAIDRAKAAIRHLDQAIIMEGYFDVLAAHQHGIENAVACMGTALTDKQISILKRLTKNFYFALDADAAGDQATLKGLELSKQVLDQRTVPVPDWSGWIRYQNVLDADIRIIEMPVGKDPDEVIGASPDEWRRLVGEALPVIDYLFRAATARLDLDDPRAKSAAVAQLLPAIREIPDTVMQAHYLQRLARIVNVEERSLQGMMRSHGTAARGSKVARPVVRHEGGTLGQAMRATREEGVVAERYCLALLLQRPELRAQASLIEPENFLFPGHREIASAWLRNPTAEGMRQELNEALWEQLDELGAMALPGLAASQSLEALNDCLQKLRKRLVLRREREVLEQELLQPAEVGDRTRAGAESTRVADLNREFTEVLNMRFKRKRAGR